MTKKQLRLVELTSVGLPGEVRSFASAGTSRALYDLGKYPGFYHSETGTLFLSRDAYRQMGDNAWTSQLAEMFVEYGLRPEHFGRAVLKTEDEGLDNAVRAVARTFGFDVPRRRLHA